MGVPGLYSYFDSKALGQRRSWATSDVASNGPPEPTTDHSDSDGSRSGSRSGSGCSGRQERYLILDGNAYIHHLYCGQFEWIWGGQYSSFSNLLIAHINALQDCGFRLQILFDGPLPLQKLETRLTRDTEKIRKMSRVMGDLEHYHVLGLNHLERHSGSMLPSEPKGKLDMLVQRAGRAGGRGSSYFLIPPLVMEATLQTLRSLGVDMMVCDGEADGLVAQRAMERSMDENVSEAYAVSKDSDYFIYNTGSSAKGGYIPLDSFLVSSDPHSKATTITATVYSQSAIAHHLGIRPQFLPLFASLTGNDYLRPEVFEDQIAKALVSASGQKLSATSNVSHARIKATAAFLKQHGAGSGCTVAASEKGSSNAKVATICESEEISRVIERILEDRKRLYSGETDGKRQELRSALEESMEQYSVTVSSRNLSSTIGRGGDSLPDINSTATTTTPSDTTVSGFDKMKEAFRSGQFSFKLMDVVYNKMFWCTPFLEDMDRESAWLASREMRRWVYGILARNLMTETSRPPELCEIDHEFSSTFDVIEYVRRGDHLSTEIVTAASRLELDEVLKSARAKANKKNARRVSVMDVDPIDSETYNNLRGDKNSQDDKAETMSIDLNLDDAQNSPLKEKEDDLDETSRTSLFLGILGADTAQVRALPQPFMVLAATLRYLINALAHSKTRSASISVANFEVIAFVASILFLRERYYPEMIPSGDDKGSQDSQSPPQQQQHASTIPNPKKLASTASISLSGSPTLDEAPPLTKRSIHLSSQYQYALATVSLLANALHLEDMMPPLATLFDGLLFQQTLALARGGTLLEQRMQYLESVTIYHRILAAVEEDFIDTGEIDVVVVFRAPSGRRGHQPQQIEEEQRVSLGIFGPEMEPVNQLGPAQPFASSSPLSRSSSSGSSSSSSSWKPAKSAGIHKKSSGTSKKRQGGGDGTSHNGSNRGGPSGGGPSGGGRGGNNANMFSVLSHGCEF